MSKPANKKKDVKSVFNNPPLSRTIPMPADTIAENYISAGWILSEMDKAGGKQGYSLVGDRVVTVGLQAMSFKKPVFVGDEVSVYADLVHMGNSSLTLRLEAWAVRRGTGQAEQVCEGQFTFVHIDQNGKPAPIPPDRVAALKKDVKPGWAPPHKSASGDGNKALHDEPKLKDRFLSLRTMPLPRDTNYMGDIFGGWILAQMDQASIKEAEKFAGRQVVTIGIEAMTFHRPVSVGDEVSFYTKVANKGTTSVTIDIECWARKKGTDLYEKVTQGLFTYVAIDPQRNPVPIR